MADTYEVSVRDHMKLQKFETARQLSNHVGECTEVTLNISDTGLELSFRSRPSQQKRGANCLAMSYPVTLPHRFMKHWWDHTGKFSSALSNFLL